MVKDLYFIHVLICGAENPTQGLPHAGRASAAEPPPQPGLVFCHRSPVSCHSCHPVAPRLVVGFRAHVDRSSRRLGAPGAGPGACLIPFLWTLLGTGVRRRLLSPESLDSCSVARSLAGRGGHPIRLVTGALGAASLAPATPCPQVLHSALLSSAAAARDTPVRCVVDGLEREPRGLQLLPPRSLDPPWVESSVVPYLGAGPCWFSGGARPLDGKSPEPRGGAAWHGESL